MHRTFFIDYQAYYLREIGWYGVDWIDMAQDKDQWRALVKTVVNFRVPYEAADFLVSSSTVGVSQEDSAPYSLDTRPKEPSFC
jgi:hypothetical protein